MGNTKTSFGTGGGQYALVAAFEGYDKLVTSGGQSTTQPVTWTAITGCTASGSRLTKTAADGWGSGGATSTRSIYDGNGSTFIKLGAGARAACGLSNGDSTQSYTDIDFALVAFTEADIRVYEGGVDKTGDLGSWTAADVFEVRCTAGTITYYQNGALLYTSATAATYPLLVDSAIYGQGDEIAHTTLRYNATSAAINAWAATDWTDAISGLRIAGTLEQEIDPWSTDLNPMELTLLIAPDASDTFGVACNQGGAGNESYLEKALSAEDEVDTGTTVVTVTDGDQFAASGSVYIGTERIDYTGNAANVLSGCTRGVYSPASRNSATKNQFGKPHPLPTIAADVAQKPLVTTVDRVWIGKEVGVWMHKVRSGVLDLKAEAQLIFYGTIEAIEDSTDGTTVVRCVSIEERLNRTVLLNDQWHAQLADGITIGEDTLVGFQQVTTSGGTNRTYTATGYTLTAGTRTIEEIAELLTIWLNADAGVNTIATYSVRIREDGCFEIQAATVSGGPQLLEPRLYSTHYLLTCFGWDMPTFPGWAGVGGTNGLLESPEPALRGIGFAGWGGVGITIDSVQGTWIDNQEWLPASVRGNTVDGENWGVIQISNGLFVAKYVSATELNPLYPLPDQSEYMQHGRYEFAQRAEGDPPIKIKQIVMLSGSMLDILARMFLSSGADGYNDSTYDKWPAQLSAGFPYEVLGTNFITSLTSLAESTAAGSLSVVLDSPTYMWDAISADLLMRVAWLTWSDGTLKFGTAVTPHSSVATHTWTESSKEGSDPSDPLRTVSTTTDEAMRNVLRVKYNRRALTDQTYGSNAEVRFTRSIQAHGERVQTIEARNSFGDDGSESVESLVADIVTKVMPLYGKPLKKMRIPMGLASYEGVSPGDVAIVSDSHMRSPVDGSRGVTQKPALVVSHSRKFTRAPVSEAEVLYVDLDRAAIYSPTAEVASYADDGADGAFTCTANAYSTAASEEDDSTHFQDNDVITCIERDPDDPAAPDSLDTTVKGTPAANVIKTDDQFAAYDAGKEYYIISRAYGSAATTQKTDCYYADTDDGQVADSRSPYEYAASPWGIYSPNDGTELAERHSDAVFADGQPVCVGAAWALAQNVNNLVNYATTPHAPYMSEAVMATDSTSYVVLAMFPVHLGPVQFPGGMGRKITLAPLFLSDDATKFGYVRVTLSRWRPTGSTTAVSFLAPYDQHAFSTKSATYETPTAHTITLASPLTYPQGDAWITIEGSVESGHSDSVRTWGLSKFWLGPLETL